MESTFEIPDEFRRQVTDATARRSAIIELRGRLRAVRWATLVLASVLLAREAYRLWSTPEASGSAFGLVTLMGVMVVGLELKDMSLSPR
jgi:hypothetical protein